MSEARRNPGLDALRGLAVVLMVQQHLGVWLTRLTGSMGAWGPLLFRLNLAGGSAAPLFVTLAGVGVAFSEGAYGSSSRRKENAAWWRRALALFAVAYALNLLTPNWFSGGSFYVLHLIASFWLLVPIVRRWPSWALLLLAWLVLTASLWAQTFLATPPSLGNARLADTTLPGGPLRLALVEGHFPILPWLSFALLGWVAGRFWLGRKLRALGGLFATLLMAGVLLQVTSAAMPRLIRSLGLRRLTAFSFYPATSSFVLLLSALSIGLIAFALWLGQRRLVPESSRWVALGRLSLTVLVLHIVLFRQFLADLGLFRALGARDSLVAVTATLLVLAVVAGLWAARDYRYSLEWCLRRLTRARAAVVVAPDADAAP